MEGKEEIKGKIQNLSSKLKENPWLVSTIALGFVCLVLLIITLKPGITGNVVSENSAGQNLISYLNSLTGGGVSLIGVEDNGIFYEVTVGYQGDSIPIYVTKDGKYYTSSLIPITAQAIQPAQTQQPQEAPKSDKPKVELYIFSYCPAGTAALDSFVQVGKILKNVAEMKVKFFSNMHGEHEKQQNMIQECIQKIANAKYWDYASQYVSKVYQVCGSARDINCDKDESIKLMKSVGIDSNAVMNCVAQNGASLYEQDKADAGALSLQYSPSVVINGVYDGNADRTPEGLKSLICSAFNTQPTECSQQLSQSSSASSGSCS